MRRRLIKILLKTSKRIKIFVPSNVRLSFYITPLGDVSSKVSFTKQDLDNIALLTEQDFVNPELFDQPTITEEGNIYALLDEGVLK
ncbi:MAG: hypothetical protein J6Q15_03525, partial [Clostridia bacterium]|nr:hypothetical protein [Clostridia bacterium]